ncbi:hypothetical protein [Brucella intermedia]|uniref:hypothetical protein n=1 Tax=Brucella intermedia TaxID=94625 RepID=UPI000DDCAA4D|nr:hypothetical protein [Brucella intermedia]WGG61955.1 hypothetical protein QA414_15680 [Brucella intermedia]
MNQGMEEYILGVLLGLKVSVGAIAARHIATSDDPDAEIQTLNDLAHKILSIEKIASSDAEKIERIKAGAEQTIDDAIGNIFRSPG